MLRLLFALCLIPLASCGVLPSPAVPPPRASGPLTWEDLQATTEEQQWVQARRQSGRPLVAATIRSPGAFEVTPSGKNSGLDWDLLEGFAAILGLKAEVKVAPTLQGFFSRNGVVPPDVTTNERLVYVPDRLQTVDLYIGPFSSLPWRERLMTVVPLYPMQNFLAGKAGQELHSLDQLAGMRVAVIRNAMQEGLLKDLAQRRGLRLELVYVDPKDDLIDVVAQGKADYTLDGQLFFAQYRFKMAGLSLSRFETMPVRVGWAMKKSDRALASLVGKYFTLVQNNGTFSRIFEANFGTSFADYMDVLAKALATEDPQ